MQSQSPEEGDDIEAIVDVGGSVFEKLAVVFKFALVEAENLVGKETFQLFNRLHIFEHASALGINSVGGLGRDLFSRKVRH